MFRTRRAVPAPQRMVPGVTSALAWSFSRVGPPPVPVAAIMTTANGIRVLVIARRREIVVLRLVGATESVVRGRFLAEGVIQGILGNKNGPHRQSRALPELPATLPPRSMGFSPTPSPTLSELRHLMWSAVGMVREGEKLRQAADTLARWEHSTPAATDRSASELASLVQVGRLVVEAALLREESRGAHYRSDYPEPSSEWERHTVFTRS